MSFTRRHLLAAGAAAIATAGTATLLISNRGDRAAIKAESNDFYRSLPMPEFLDARKQQNNIELIAQEGMTEIVPTYRTPTYGYSSSYLGPVIQVQCGDTINMKITNALDKVTTVHWHGLFVPSELDGGPAGVIEPGQVWQPSLYINQPASTAWYHPHPHGDTARQVYMGLAGLIYVNDGTSNSLGLPNRYGLDDLPIILQDKFFTADGDMIYDASPIAILHGSRGNTIIVNGIYGPVAEVPKGIVRLRLLNGSNARNFRLVFDDYRPMHVIANDNGFIANTVPITELTIAPGERYEVLVDFSDGLVSALLTYPDKMGRPATELSDNINEMMSGLAKLLTPVMRFDPIDDVSVIARSIPAKLVDLPIPTVPDGIRQRNFILDSMIAINMPMTVQTVSKDVMEHSQLGTSTEMNDRSGLAVDMKMAITGKTFDITRVDVEVQLGSREIWQVQGTEMAHPFHIHGASFRIVNMDGAIPPEHLMGSKDTVLVNDFVQLLVSFDQPASPSRPFVFHCQILEHEDAGMMGQYVTI